MERPKCRVCHEEIARGKPMCYACDQGYEAALSDVVAWLRIEYPGESARAFAMAIERGDAAGFSTRKGP